MKDEWIMEEWEVAVWSDDAVDNFINWIFLTIATSLLLGFALMECGFISVILGVFSFGMLCGAIYFGLKMFESRVIRVQVKRNG